MSRHHDVILKLSRRVGWHAAVNDPAVDPRNRSRWLPELRRWQANRLELSFARFLEDPRRRAAAQFFLTDVYGDRDFARRDADIVKVIPMMQKLLPERLLDTIASAIELGALSHALDLRMAETLQRLAPRGRRLSPELYGRAYRETGLPRLRAHQISLIEEVGAGFGRALKQRGVAALLAFSRGPARLAGLNELQGFLERGYAAFDQLGDVEGFVGEIGAEERALMRRLFEGHPSPFDLA